MKFITLLSTWCMFSLLACNTTSEEQKHTQAKEDSTLSAVQTVAQSKQADSIKAVSTADTIMAKPVENKPKSPSNSSSKQTKPKAEKQVSTTVEKQTSTAAWVYAYGIITYKKETEVPIPQELLEKEGIKKGEHNTYPGGMTYKKTETIHFFTDVKPVRGWSEEIKKFFLDDWEERWLREHEQYSKKYISNREAYSFKTEAEAKTARRNDMARRNK